MLTMYNSLDALPPHKLTSRSKLTFDLENIIALAIANEDTFTLAKVYQHVHDAIPKVALDLIDAEQQKFVQAVNKSNLSQLSWYLDKITLDFQFVNLGEGFREAVKENNLIALRMMYDVYPDVDEILEWARYYDNLEILELYEKAAD